MCHTCLDTLIEYCNSNEELISRLSVPVAWHHNKDIPCKQKLELIGTEIGIFKIMRTMLKKTKDISMEVKWESNDIYLKQRMLHNGCIHMYFAYCQSLVAKLTEVEEVMSLKMGMRRSRFITDMMGSLELVKSLCIFTKENEHLYYLPCRKAYVLKVNFFHDVFTAFLDFQESEI